MNDTRQVLGKWGEHMAGEYLMNKGYQVIEYNARTPYGEIDIVALQTFEKGLNPENNAADNFEIVVFVEVKTRTTEMFGPPEVSINARKREHILASSQDYLQSHPELAGDWRVDVIAIQRKSAGSPPQITHFENAFAGFETG